MLTADTTVTWSPEQVPILQPRPYRGRAPPLSYQGSAPGSGVEPEINRVKAGLPTADGALPEWSRLPVPTRISRLTRAGSQPCATASCPRRDLNAHYQPPRDCASAIGLRGLEPPPGADPGHPPYEGGAAAVRGGEAAGQGLEPRFATSGAAVLPLDDPALVREEGLEPSRHEDTRF